MSRFTPLLVLFLVSATIGFFSALVSPTSGALWARGILYTVNTCAAPLVLIVAGAISWLAYGLAQAHPNSLWKKVWINFKFCWKVYGVTLLSMLLFAIAVALTNIVRLHQVKHLALSPFLLVQ